MNTLEEYNTLMYQAGKGAFAKQLEKQYKPGSEVDIAFLPPYTEVDLKRLRNERYRLKHRERLLEYRQQRVNCECGAVITKPNIRTHQRTAKCKQRRADRLKNPHTKALASCVKVHDPSSSSVLVTVEEPSLQLPS